MKAMRFLLGLSGLFSSSKAATTEDSESGLFWIVLD